MTNINMHRKFKAMRMGLVAFILMPMVALAQPELEKTMKSMGQNFKALAKQVAIPAQNAASIGLAEEMLKLVNQAKDVMPDTIAELQEPERSKAFVDFQDRLAAVSKGLNQLIEALKANDNAGASKIVEVLNQAKKDGHSKYKKP